MPRCISKSLGVLFCFSAFAAIPSPAVTRAQDLATSPIQSTDSAVEETAEEARERATAEKFFELLKRRPRLGTALDKVYGYHVGRGTLDAFAEQLQTDATQSSDGNLWLVLGMVQMQRGQDALAVDSLTKAEERLPTEPLASYYLGKTQVLIGDVDLAAEAMQRAIEKKPARADALQIFQDLGRIYQRTGRNQQALDTWKQLEELFPGDAGVQEQIAAILADEGAEEAALERYTELAKSSKDRFRQVEMAIRAAQLKAKLGRADEALADFEAQLAVVNPDSWLYRDVRRRIEEVFWTSSDFDGLVSYYTKWTQAHPDDVDAMLRTARVLSIQKRTPEAQQWFRKAIERAPSNVEARQALVEALATDGEYAKAAVEMEKLVEIEKDNPDFIVRWGELVFNDSEKPKAERQLAAAEIWKRMLASRRDDPVTVARVADLLRGAELPEQAIEQYRGAISLAENEPQYREYLGEYLHQLQRKEEALAVWEELASGPRHTRDNIVRLSEVLSTFHYDDRALEKMAEACEMKPTFGQRARYAELLREAGEYDLALSQLDLAEPLADDRELRELLIDERIKNYQGKGDLLQRIAELELAVAEASKEDAAAWRMLALMREANRAFQAACEAIDQATLLAGDDALYFETAAALYERTGRFGEAIKAYRKLATIDRRFLSNYLTQIASLEMRLGNIEAALEAGEELLSSAPGNSDNYRFFAGLCMQAGQTARALETLRRNVRSHPSDSDAITFLAKTLADEFQTDEAIELYWRSFDLTANVDGKIPCIEALTELYLRTNRFDMLLSRLELISREENKPRDGALWIAAAHQAAGDLGMARQLLEQLVREDSRDTRLLEQLVTLSKTEYDFETAAEYQKRLVAISPSTENEHLLATLLMELGEIDEAQSLWMKLSQRGRGTTDLLSSINSLIAKDQFDIAGGLVERALQMEPDNWELSVPAMIVQVRSDNMEQAKQTAQHVLSLNIDPKEPSKKTKEAIAKAAVSKQTRPGYDPYASLGTPSRVISSMRMIKQALEPASNDPFSGYSPSRQPFTPSCFADARAVATGVQLVAIADAAKRKEFVAQMTEEALATADVELLWRAVFCISFEQSAVRGVPGGNTNTENDFESCLDKLAEVGDSEAAALLLSQEYSQRMTATQQGATQPLSDEELTRLASLNELSAESAGPRGNLFQFWLAEELRRAGKEKEAQDLQDKFLSESPEPLILVQAVSSLMQVVYRGTVDAEQAKMAIKNALPLYLRALDETSAKTSNSQYIGSSMVRDIPGICMYGDVEDAIQLVDAVLRMQSRLTADMRPSQRDQMQSNANMNYGYYLGGNYQQAAVNFPPPSGYFDSAAIFAVHSLWLGAKQVDKVDRVQAAVDAWAAADSDDPYLKFVRLMAKACLEVWTEQPRAALETITQVDGLIVGSQFTRLLQARMQYDSGDVRGALATIESFRPSNQKMLVDRELTLLQLVLQLGDLEQAKKSAQKLFALRLDSDTEFKLADLMYQLGMKEMGDRMMGRIRRRAGGKQDTLVQLMQRYATAGEMESAAEIARQVLRRTRPATSTRYRTSESMQHEQALQILVRAKQIEPLVNQYEKLVERSPKAMQLVDQLAAAYEAMGRREDAQKLRLKSAETVPNDPRNLLAAAQQLSASGATDKAVEMYIEAVRKSPQIFSDSFYDMRTAFSKNNSWPKLVDAIIDMGMDKFAQNYRIGSLCDELVRAKQDAAANKLFLAVVESGDMYTLGYVLRSSYSRADTFEVDDELARMVADKLCDASQNSGSVSYIHSFGSGGVATGVANYLVRIVQSNDKETERVSAQLKKQLDANDKALFPRVLLCLLHAERNQFSEMEELIEPLLEKKTRDQQTSQALWSIASQIVDKEKSPELTAKILESFDNLDPILFGMSGLNFENSAENLLIRAYENVGEQGVAKQHLLRVMAEMKIDESQNQYNPGYGEYQYLQSMDGISRRLIAMDCPAEAFIAYRKAYGDAEMLKKTERYSGSWSARQKSLDDLIQRQMTPDVVLGLLKAATSPPSEIQGGNDPENSPSPAGTENIGSYLTTVEQIGSSMADARLALPLEQFAAKIGEDDKLKTAVEDWLQKEPLSDEQQLSALISRLVICRAVGNAELTDETIARIRAWLATHAASASSDLPDESDNEHELLLAIAARSLPETTEQNALAVDLIERALAAASELGKEDLSFGLRCQLASRIAAADKPRARELFQQALDDLLPGKK